MGDAIPLGWCGEGGRGWVGQVGCTVTVGAVAAESRILARLTAPPRRLFTVFPPGGGGGEAAVAVCLSEDGVLEVVRPGPAHTG